ncbi:MAG: hypothetical protein WCD79_23165 [Chthoniobacteraceae bacterium]
MRTIFGTDRSRYQPAGNGRRMLVLGILLVILTIIYFTKDTPARPNPHPRPTARGQ